MCSFQPSCRRGPRKGLAKSANHTFAEWESTEFGSTGQDCTISARSEKDVRSLQAERLTAAPSLPRWQGECVPLLKAPEAVPYDHHLRERLRRPIAPQQVVVQRLPAVDHVEERGALDAPFPLLGNKGHAKDCRANFREETLVVVAGTLHTRAHTHTPKFTSFHCSTVRPRPPSTSVSRVEKMGSKAKHISGGICNATAGRGLTRTQGLPRPSSPIPSRGPQP